MSKSKPPLRKPSVDLTKLDHFASAAGFSEPEPTPSRWLKIQVCQNYCILGIIGVRSDVVKGMDVPLSEPYLLKLRFIAQQTKWSQRKFCQVKLEEAIDREIEEILMSSKDKTFALVQSNPRRTDQPESPVSENGLNRTVKNGSSPT